MDLDAWLAEGPVSVGVSGDSMEPALRDGDRVEVSPAAPSDLRPGDLVVFRAGDSLVVHRLLLADAAGFLEMGDNRALGARYPWPRRIGRVTAVLGAGGRVDLGTPEARRGARAIAGRSLRCHRAEAFASRLPGRLLPRILRGLARRLIS